MGGPPGDPAHHEHRREHFHVESHQVVRRTGREVEVRRDPGGGGDRLLQDVVHPHPLLAAGGGGDVEQCRLHRRHPRVTVLVDPVTETHHLLLGSEFAQQPLLGAVGLADLEHVVHDGLVGAAVQRTLQRPDRRGDRTVDVGQCRRHHAGRERGRVETVLRIQDQRHLERCDDGRIGHLPEAHVQKVLREPQVRVRCDRVLSAPAPEVCGHDRGQHRRHAQRLREVLGRRIVVPRRVFRAE
nr:hypothetical protein JVH1_2139 [Rhodococcus sp. JVH1]